MNRPPRAANASPEEIINNSMELALANVDHDYSQLVRPEEWQNILLAGPQLETLRNHHVSWENGKIELLLGDHIKKMRDAGVKLDVWKHGFIIFTRIDQS
jgi:hypothetical protein